MSVMKKVDVDQSEAIGWSELNERERKFVQLFRLLDEVSQKDLIRFLDVLLASQ
ncbi:hypothetical protein [Pseudomonas sp. G2-4]|uniref:hypothetical protein n=1 Tax=Pseudomonas sp. G2-4 TaxID=1506334 RepID=UPI0024BA87A9|nr:hypothetical protein [Pseudomonas sp. G2-4]WHS62249.1 hypothetical protein QNH97_09435 [Pseudomonas sp. G2-4]